MRAGDFKSCFTFSSAVNCYPARHHPVHEMTTAIKNADDQHVFVLEFIKGAIINTEDANFPFHDSGLELKLFWFFHSTRCTAAMPGKAWPYLHGMELGTGHHI